MLRPVRHERCGFKRYLGEQTNNQAACGLVVKKGLHGIAYRGDGSNGEKQNGDGFLQARSAEGTVTTPGPCLHVGVEAYASPPTACVCRRELAVRLSE